MVDNYYLSLNFLTCIAKGYITGCSGLAHSRVCRQAGGFGRRTNHLDGDSRRTPGDIALAHPTGWPWTASENERDPYQNIPENFIQLFLEQLRKLS